MTIYIKSSKHGVAKRLRTSLGPALGTSLAASALVLASPYGAMAQSRGDSLPAVEVSDSKETFKADKVSSPKFVAPLVDTTQTISVIRKELMQSQLATTLTDALQNSAGVGTFSSGENGRSETGDAIIMRGFSTAGSIFVDNIRDLGGISRDLFNIEQVEVVKGPAGADNGRGAPTGYINMVTKQPTLDDKASAEAVYGSASHKRLTADLSRVVNEDNGTAFRLNLLKQESGVPGRDRIRNDRWGIAPSLGFGLGTPTRTILSYQHLERDNVPDGGIPTIGQPGFYNASLAALGITAPAVRSANFYGTAGDYDKSISDMLTVRIEHDYNANVSLRNTTRYARNQQNYRVANPFSITGPSLDPSTWTLRRLAVRRDQQNEILTNQTNAIIKFDTGSLQHAVTTGIELIREKQYNTGFASATLSNASVYAPDPYAPAVIPAVTDGTYTQGSTDTIGLYVFDTIKINQAFQVNGGIRLDRYSADYRGVALSTATSHPALPVGTLVPLSLSKQDTFLNWKLGALFKPTANGSLYAAYATSQQPPGGDQLQLSDSNRSASSTQAAPQKTSTVELGTKWEVFDKKLLLTGALFRTEVSNEIKQDATTGTLFTQDGKKRVDGIELAAAGELTPAWSLNASVALMNAKITNGTTNAAATRDQDNAALSFSPRKAFSMWSIYRLPSGLSFGGGARFVDTISRRATNSVAATDNTPYAQSYWVADAMAAYHINRHASVQLNVYNLTNASYIGAINNGGSRFIPSAPRSVKLSLNMSY